MAPPGRGCSGGEAEAAALHADLQAVRRLTAGVDDATVHVTGQVTVAALLRRTAAAETRVVSGAGAAGGTVQHDVAQSEELTEEAGQNTVNTAVWGEKEKHWVSFLKVPHLTLFFRSLYLIRTGVVQPGSSRTSHMLMITM